MKAGSTVLSCALLCACSEDAEPNGIDASTDIDNASAADASAPSPCMPPALRMPELDAQVMRLSELGLYTDIASKQTACDLLTWEPRYPLWSDGADKHRYMRLPGSVDSADPDHYRFPVGAVLFKEFAREGKRLETRVVARVSERDTFFGAFAWRDDESDADLILNGAQDVRGTDHDIPSSQQCITCHAGEPGRVLGLSALQVPQFARVTQRAPATEVSDALGYLHGNCGHCHNAGGYAWSRTDMTLRLSVLDGASALLRSVAQPATKPLLGLGTRVVPGDPAASLLLARMQTRTHDPMPPIATEHVDPQGTALVSAWIAGLSAGSGP